MSSGLIGESDSGGNQGKYHSIAQDTTPESKMGIEMTAIQDSAAFTMPEVQEMQEEELIEFEFQVTGMTCVNCSNNITRKVKAEFESKQMRSMDIILLVHKMLTRFPLRVFKDKSVTPQMICDFVTGIGFKCELLCMNEIENEE